MIRTGMFLAAIFAMCPAWAINMNGFRDAPITRLSESELKTFRTALMQVLDQVPDGTTVEWKAPTAKFTSKITPARTYTDGKLKCRNAVIESDAQDRYQRGLYSFCKAANGEWQFKSPEPKPRPRQSSR